MLLLCVSNVPVSDVGDHPPYRLPKIFPRFTKISTEYIVNPAVILIIILSNFTGIVSPDFRGTSISKMATYDQLLFDYLFMEKKIINVLRVMELTTIEKPKRFYHSRKHL